MSSIRLKKDHAGKKAGTVISVPFLVGKVLIADGTGEYPGDHPKAGLVELPESAPKPKAKGTEAKQPEAKSTLTPLVEDEPHTKTEFPPQPQPQPLSGEKHKQPK